MAEGVLKEEKFKTRLSSFSYNQLQSLAKENGIRANVKGQKLINSLTHHFISEGNLSADDIAVDDRDTENQPVARSLTAIKDTKKGKKLVGLRKSIQNLKLPVPENKETSEKKDIANQEDVTPQQSPNELDQPPRRKPNKRSSQRTGESSSEDDDVFGDEENLNNNSRYTEFVNSDKKKNPIASFWKPASNSSGRKRKSVDGQKNSDETEPPSPKKSLFSPANKRASTPKHKALSTATTPGKEVELKKETASAQKRQEFLYAEIERRVAASKGMETEEKIKSGSGLKKQESGRKTPANKTPHKSPVGRGTPSSTSKFASAHAKLMSQMETLEEHAEKIKKLHAKNMTSCPQRIAQLAGTPGKKTEAVKSAAPSPRPVTPGSKAVLKNRQKVEERQTQKVGLKDRTTAASRVVKPVKGRRSSGINAAKLSTPTSVKKQFKFGIDSPSNFKFTSTVKIQPSPHSSINSPANSKKVNAIQKSMNSTNKNKASTRRKSKAEAGLNETYDTDEDGEIPEAQVKIAKKTTKRDLTAETVSSAIKKKAKLSPKKKTENLKSVATTLSSRIGKSPQTKLIKASPKKQQTPNKSQKNMRDRMIQSKAAGSMSTGGKLGYKPHRGPLKPFVDTSTMSADKALAVKACSPRTMTRMRQGRSMRRLELGQERKKKAENKLMEKRGIRWRI